MTTPLEIIKQKLAEIREREQKAHVSPDRCELLYGRIDRIGRDPDAVGLLSRECAEIRELIRIHKKDRIDLAALVEALELAIEYIDPFYAEHILEIARILHGDELLKEAAKHK